MCSRQRKQQGISPPPRASKSLRRERTHRNAIIRRPLFSKSKHCDRHCVPYYMSKSLSSWTSIACTPTVLTVFHVAVRNGQSNPTDTLVLAQTRLLKNIYNGDHPSTAWCVVAGHLGFCRLPCLLVANSSLLAACGAVRGSFSPVRLTFPSVEKGSAQKVHTTKSTVCASTGARSCIVTHPVVQHM